MFSLPWGASAPGSPDAAAGGPISDFVASRLIKPRVGPETCNWSWIQQQLESDRKSQQTLINNLRNDLEATQQQLDELTRDHAATAVKTAADQERQQVLSTVAALHADVQALRGIVRHSVQDGKLLDRIEAVEAFEKVVQAQIVEFAGEVRGSLKLCMDLERRTEELEEDFAAAAARAEEDQKVRLQLLDDVGACKQLLHGYEEVQRQERRAELEDQACAVQREMERLNKLSFKMSMVEEYMKEHSTRLAAVESDLSRSVQELDSRLTATRNEVQGKLTQELDGVGQICRQLAANIETARAEVRAELAMSFEGEMAVRRRRDTQLQEDVDRLQEAASKRAAQAEAWSLMLETRLAESTKHVEQALRHLESRWHEEVLAGQGMSQHWEERTLRLSRAIEGEMAVRRRADESEVEERSRACEELRASLLKLQEEVGAIRQPP